MKKLIARIFGRKRDERVPFYDPATRKTVSIPREELSTSAILVRIQGFPAPVYVDAREVKQSDEVLQPPFEGEEKHAIESLVIDLADVYPMSYKQWEDGFRCEPRPQKEIAGWVHLASILKVISKQFGMDLTEKKECFRVLVACFNGERSTVRARSSIKSLSDEKVDQAIKYWFEGEFA